ncbi:MAG: fimbiral protein pilA [Myxococcales bacterium]|nr:fimbiral protein pilA [Myxococcales bacterium]
MVESSEGLGAVATVAALTATSIFGVRRYLTASKTAEAKNTIGAIARGAVAGYERETGASTTHALCKSAQAVPTVVPSGTKYQPSADPGKDYETGTSLSGWRCLKFTITNPHYYQYDYRTGGNYKGPKRGLPDPGPNGFEASAEGDLDGDGKTSLFTLTGRVINGVVKLDTQLNVADELE